jgi:hypothetical protein
MNNFQFDYEGIVPLNYKGKQTINDDLEEILKNTINTTIDWKKRENALKKLGQICLGDQGNSDIFIKTFNGQLATHLGIQMADLRSSVMKEACRITSLCGKELGISIEQGATTLLTQYVLFKIAGSANRVISDSSSKCILNLVKYVNSIKVISNICEQKSMKSNFVRNICAQCILYIVTCYKKNLIMKTNKLLQDTMKSLLSDANGGVRATTRRAFITYRKRFEIEGDELFDNLEKNVQKQIIEDEKKYGESIIVDSEDGGEFTFDNSKNKYNLLYGTSNKSRSQEVKYNIKNNMNIDKVSSTFQKELDNEELYDKENETDANVYSRHFSDTTEYSENLQNDKSEDNINTNVNKIKNKGNKSFKGKEVINPYNCFSKTTKLNNKELLKKLNDKFYIDNLQKSDNAINNNFINTNDNNEPQKVVKHFNSSVNKKTKPKKNINKSNNNNNNTQNNNDNNINNNNNKNSNNIQNKKNTLNNKQNNINNKQNNVNINNFIQNNNNVKDSFNININKDSMEYKIIDKMNQLSMNNNIKEKIKIFQYLFNSFNDILTDVNNISDITLRQFVDIHIEYIKYEDKLLTEQIIKNLMRMIFYMTQIFTSNDIIIIVKLLMIKISIGEKSVSKLSYELLDLIRKKWKIEDIYKGIFNLLEEKKLGYNDVCYEYLTLLVIYCGNIFEDINYFRKIIEIICNGNMNSKKIGKLIEALYKNNPKNFSLVLKELNYEDQQKILYFFENKNDSIIKGVKPNQERQEETTKNNNTCGKIKKIVNPKSNSNNNNNSNNSNELNEIKKFIENGNVKSFIDFLDNNKEYFPKFLLLLSDEKYSNQKYVKNILNLIYSLIALSNNLHDEISQYMEILIDQLISFFLMNINNSFIVDMVKEILNIMPNKINNEKYYKSISKYLNNKTNVILLQALLLCMKNCIINDKSKNLEKQLPIFIKGIFNLLEHPSNDVRKYAIYCCVEIYMILEHKFDPYLELLPKNQQNLINLFIKKKNC